MISIIICSRANTISDRLLHNIQETISVEYELIVIDNSENKYSIFEAYNIGLNKSKNEIICFIHDDINLITKDWGKVLIDIFTKNTNIGLIGIAGAKSKTKMPSAWWDCPQENLCINIIQHFSYKEKEHWFRGFEETSLKEVVAVDGVFMAARKVSTILFNTQLTGFHNYDLNLSFEYLKKGYKVFVTKDILLEHFSIGVLNESWYRSTLDFHKVYENFLPLNKSAIISLKKQEFNNGAKFSLKLLEFQIIKPAVYIWLKLILLKPISRYHFYFLKNFFKKATCQRY